MFDRTINAARHFVMSPSFGFILLGILYGFFRSTVTELYAIGGAQGVAIVANTLGYIGLSMVAAVTLYVVYQAASSLISFCYHATKKALGWREKDIYDASLQNIQHELQQQLEGAQLASSQIRLVNQFLGESCVLSSFDVQGVPKRAQANNDRLVVARNLLTRFRALSQEGRRVNVQSELETLRNSFVKP